ncbi:MAG: hypothetical protein AAF629_08060 [Chloroflexota bacterium]
MSEKVSPQINQCKPSYYQIKLEGHLSKHWLDWFEGLTIRLEDNGETTLTGPIADQAALYGLLRKVRDLGIPLLALKRLEVDNDDVPNL